jgi:hypothetical protein
LPAATPKEPLAMQRYGEAGNKFPSLDITLQTLNKENTMSDDITTPASTGKKPAFIAYSVRERKNKKAKFTEIGVAFPHKDGKGFDILYDAIPLSGRITLRVQEPRQ